MENNITYLCTNNSHQAFFGSLSYTGNILSNNKDDYSILVRCSVPGCPGSVFPSLKEEAWAEKKAQEGDKGGE